MPIVGLAEPCNLLLRRPVLASLMFEHHDYPSWNSALPPWLSDFAILIHGHLWRWQVEWLTHYPLAIKAGLSETVAADLKTSRRPQPMKPDKAAVYDFWMDLPTKHEVSDDVYARVKAVLTDQQIVGLIGPSGTYVTVAMLLAAAEKWVPQASSHRLRSESHKAAYRDRLVLPSKLGFYQCRGIDRSRDGLEWDSRSYQSEDAFIGLCRVSANEADLTRG